MEKTEKSFLEVVPVKKLLIKFAIPCVLAMLVSALYNIVDQIFIGNSAAGTAGIMATTLVFPFTVVALALAMTLGDGCAALFSLSFGAKDERTANKAVGNTLICIVIVSLILMGLGFLLQGPIFSVLGVGNYSTECQAFTSQYYQIILIGIPFYMFTSCVASIVRASGAPGYSMIATVIGAVINLILDPILIFVCKLGIQGAALATIIGQIASAIAVGVYFIKPKMMKIKKSDFIPNGRTIGLLSKLGLSSFVTQFSIAVITIVANNVVGSVGGPNATDAGGALGIVFKIFAIVLAFSLGVSVGGQPIIGYNYGAKNSKRVIETYKYILICNIVIGLIATILFEACPQFIVSMFGGNATDLVFYQNFSAAAFRIYLGGIGLCCIQKSSCIFLQSIDKPYKAMILSLMRDVIILVPGVCILGFSGGLYTMLWAGPIADIGSFIITIIFVTMELKKIKRMKNELNLNSQMQF